LSPDRIPPCQLLISGSHRGGGTCFAAIASRLGLGGLLLALASPLGAQEFQRHALQLPTPEVAAAASGRDSQVLDLLPYWRESPSRLRILAFLRQAITPGPLDVAPAERIAVFDNDATFWSEQPMAVQLAFALDRARALGIQVDPARLRAEGMAGEMQLVARTHAGKSTEAFTAIVRDWIRSARHPTLQRPYTDLPYQPMLELLAALRAHGFKTWIVSDGSNDFMRVFSESLYAIPPAQVIGGTIITIYQEKDGVPVLMRRPQLDFLGDQAGKPVAIQRVIGRLDRGLDEAQQRGWGVISVRDDWSQIYRLPAASVSLGRSPNSRR
jgi:phosphoglycolate phosphatase-like HAD superfamily hydrolase